MANGLEALIGLAVLGVGGLMIVGRLNQTASPASSGGSASTTSPSTSTKRAKTAPVPVIHTGHGESTAPPKTTAPKVKTITTPYGESTNPKKAAQSGRTYVVQSGDTLSGIAQAAGVSLGALERVNPQIKNINLIDVGEVIHLPANARKLQGEVISA